MERRLIVAILLMIVVAVLPSLFIKSPRRPTAPVDSTQARAAAPDTAPAAAPPKAEERKAVRPAPTRKLAAPTETVTVATPLARYTLSSAGATLEGAELSAYRMFGAKRGAAVELMRPGDRLLAHQIVLGRDTIRLDSAEFSAERTADGVTFRGRAGGVDLALSYSYRGGSDYVLDVAGELGGLGGQGALVLVGLGSGFANTEADSIGNYRSYGAVGRRTEPQGLAFSKVAPGETATLDGPFDWVALKSKYFIGALLSPDSTKPSFGGLLLLGGPRPGRYATQAQTWATLPVGPDGKFRYSLYLGPQEYRHLRKVGRELEKASPYGWIFKPIVMPIAVWITELLLWMHQTLSLAYGWVLVLFGVAVRLLLWPLNQKAMKSSVAMQAVQPLMKDIQTRHKDDPQRLQQEMLKLYKEHKVNPLGGCLPMLLPMPILFALFFVFANTIAFRGVSFLWLPDLSLRDPTYVIPVVMGASMWALSKLGQMGMPPNPQAKMMTTIMPIMMTVLFLNFASGLNLYYAVSNLVSLPQQYMINKARAAEMARRKGTTA
ncbi:MAG: membrane protein insertase YidC [Gemmatimonadales bacterium]|jgi:YidC/Oxa1 family membrane protein insertase